MLELGGRVAWGAWGGQGKILGVVEVGRGLPEGVVLSGG